jgi:hypothetical protein
MQSAFQGGTSRCRPTQVARLELLQEMARLGPAADRRASALETARMAPELPMSEEGAIDELRFVITADPSTFAYTIRCYARSVGSE